MGGYVASKTVESLAPPPPPPPPPVSTSAEEAARREKQTRAAANGRGATILTSATGDSSSPSTGRAALLGQ